MGMPGMSRGPNIDDPRVVAAFHAALVHQGIVVMVLLAAVAVVWNLLRSAQLRQVTSSGPYGVAANRAAGGSGAAARGVGGARSALGVPGTRVAEGRAIAGVQHRAETWASASPEPPARRLLRIAFGLLWLFDGVLQAQASMPLGMVPDVLRPAADGSPGWVVHLVSVGTGLWSAHPVDAAAAAVWIQLGLGLWLLVAPRGTWSRLAAVATVEWALVVWVFGEAFGGILAPGSSWLFGTPGGVLFYAAAGVLLALPEEAWASPRLGRIVAAGLGLFLVGMAVLQAWPGRGFWHGRTAAGVPGTLTAMVQQMAQTPQPGVLASWIHGFAGVVADHGGLVNAVAVVGMAGSGTLLVVGRRRALTVGAVGAIVLGLAAWVLVQDLGFLGGTGTDPNSMVPMVLLVAGAVVAVRRVPATSSTPVIALPLGSAATASAAGTAAATAAGTAADASPGTTVDTSPGTAPPGVPWRERVMADPARTLRQAAAAAAVGVVLVGAVPMTAAAASRQASPLVAEAVDGAPEPVNAPAPPISLVDQHDRPVSLTAWRRDTVVVTFLDPVCTSDCPIIAQELRTADQMLGAAARRVVLLAVDANPFDIAPADLQAFDRQEGMDHLPNWYYATGTLAQLEQVWDRYGVLVSYEPGGNMIDHSDAVDVIAPGGRLRSLLTADPAGASSADVASFATLVVEAVHQAQAGR
jgi:cytochrome oxidase Cu insertion factor (SCO1/SenC/PrrC family)